MEDQNKDQAGSEDQKNDQSEETKIIDNRTDEEKNDQGGDNDQSGKITDDMVEHDEETAGDKPTHESLMEGEQPNQGSPEAEIADESHD